MGAVLGLSAFYHDAAAALVVDGRLVAAAQEERFSRRKHDASFPRAAVAYCLKEAGLAVPDLEAVAFYEKPLLKFDRILDTHLAVAPTSLPTFVRAMPSWLRTKLRLDRALRRGLGGAYTKRFVWGEHHLSHAASAFLPSPFEEAAILTLDGVGEWATASVGRGAGSTVTLLDELHFPHSLGLLYSAFTVLTGFAVNDGEYKLMGLAPYGEPRFADLIRERLLDLKPDGSFAIRPGWFGWVRGRAMTTPRLHRLFGREPRAKDEPLTQLDMDLAASVQRVTEDVMLAAARHAHARTGSKRLCLAGGVALNCVGNGRIVREGPFEEVWIQPAAGDAGGALGAALWVAHALLGQPRARTDGMSGARLGPRFSPADVRALLGRENVPFETFAGESALLDRVAALLADGRVVGWFSGRMEVGPRALGSRSILADPRDAAMQSRVNQMVKFRESFRPFAPAVLAERAQEWFGLAPAKESPYMLVVAPVAAAKRLASSDGDAGLRGLDRLRARRSTVPAVTHVDGSARLQTVDRVRDPRFHALLQAFEARTGCPVLVNTSFNVKDEPIVLTPEDALRCFERTGIDALVLEDVVVLAAAKRVGGSGGGASATPNTRRAETRDAIEGAFGDDASSGPSARELAWFPLGPLLLGGILVVLLRRWNEPVGIWILVGSLLLSLVLFALPRVRVRAYRAWMRIALPIGRVLTAALLALIYLLVVTPVGLLLRLFGRDPLAQRPDPRATTYWRPYTRRVDPGSPFRPY
jgi:carbamoyltransferase